MWKIEENEDFPDRNLIVHFDVPNELMDRVKNLINKRSPDTE